MAQPGSQLIEYMKTNKTKEKADMILEPLQVMITLAQLNFYPIGTKIKICKNVLYLHEPSSLQGLFRWLDGDSKDDLYYLFHAIRRYYKWYKTLDDKIYVLILKLAKEGIKKLISTYQAANHKTILHTLSLYHNILELNNPELFNTDNTAETVNIDQVFQNIKSIYDRRLLTIVFSTFRIIEDSTNNAEIQSHLNGLKTQMESTEIQIQSWIQTNLTL
tara:strand:+ start:1539 stop:2192 length:654 start_codon:yes stop_codon:yes gene_type:complete